MKYFTRVGMYDVEPLLHELDSQPELFGERAWRKQIDGGPHSGMSDIWLRYNSMDRLQRDGPNVEHDSLWYPAYEKLPAVKRIVFPLMALVHGERLGGVLITRIPPGAGIDRHVDRGWHVEYYDKFYVSLRSAPGAKFICHEAGDETLQPMPGECWRFDNRLPHSVVNESAEDRITLIVCIRTEQFQGPYARAS